MRLFKVFFTIFMFAPFFFNVATAQIDFCDSTVMIQMYAMKKPGVVPISFLVKNNNEYTMYQFSIKLNKWGDSSDISVKSIKCDSSEYVQDSTIIKKYSIGNVFFEQMYNYYPRYIYSAIFGNDYPMKLDELLNILVRKSQTKSKEQ